MAIPTYTPKPYHAKPIWLTALFAVCACSGRARPAAPHVANSGEESLGSTSAAGQDEGGGGNAAAAQRCRANYPEAPASCVFTERAGSCAIGESPGHENATLCSCALCQRDADCTGGKDGRCIELDESSACNTQHRICVYAGEPCHPGAAPCGAYEHCAVDRATMKASCVRPEKPA